MGLIAKMREKKANSQEIFTAKFNAEGKILAVYGGVGEPGAMYECSVGRKIMKLPAEAICETKPYQDYINSLKKDDERKNYENSEAGQAVTKVLNILGRNDSEGENEQ